MTWRDHLGTGGLVGATCTACCVPPLIASLGLVGGLAIAAGLVTGIAVAGTELLAGVAIVTARRRRTTTTCDPTDGPVLVTPPPRRAQ